MPPGQQPRESLSATELRSAYPFLDATDQDMVVGGDIDALLSAAFLSDRLDWTVVGFYTDFREVYYTDRTAARNAVWVDLDVSRPTLRSVGHHIVRGTADEDLDGLERSCNLNEVRGVSREQFTRKYPLGTIHFLLWLHGADGFSPLQRALLLTADSAWINGQSHNYGDNVSEWVENCLPMDWLVDALEEIQTEAFETRIRDEVYPRLETIGFSHGGTSGWTTSKHYSLNGWQCEFSDPRTEKVQALVERIGDVMGWDTFEVPSDLARVRGDRHSIDYSTMRSRHGDLDGLLREEDVFSYAISSYRTVNYTTAIDL